MTIFVVSGLHRSGTSMMMNILYAGGIEVLDDNRRKADIHNPNGYFEFNMKLQPEVFRDADGKAVKILGRSLKRLLSDKEYRIIWMERNIEEIIQSWHIFKGYSKWVEVNNREYRIKEEKILRDNAITLLEKQKNVEYMIVKYTDVIYNPDKEIEKIQKFLGVKLDLKKAIAIVDKNLYRNKI